MKEYLLTLVGVVLLSGVVMMIGPNDSAKKYIRLLGSLCVLCVLISPLAALLRGGAPDLGALWDELTDGTEQNYDEIYKDALAKQEIGYAEDLLEKAIQSEFSVASTDLEIRMKTVSKNNIYEVESVHVILRDRAVLIDPRAVSDFVNDRVGVSCVVVYD